MLLVDCSVQLKDGQGDGNARYSGRFYAFIIVIASFMRKRWDSGFCLRFLSHVKGLLIFAKGAPSIQCNCINR